MKELRETFEDDEFRFLKQVKSDRPWRRAILEEFGYGEDHDDGE